MDDVDEEEEDEDKYEVVVGFEVDQKEDECDKGDDDEKNVVDVAWDGQLKCAINK